MTKSSTKKMNLNKHTLRALLSRDLEAVQGGLPKATRQSDCPE